MYDRAASDEANRNLTTPALFDDMSVTQQRVIIAFAALVEKRLRAEIAKELRAIYTALETIEGVR
jgi:hypothetical protein